MKDYNKSVRWPGVAAGLGVAAALAVACTTAGGAAGAPGVGVVGGTPPPCSAPRGGQAGPATKPTTVTTIGQAYFCIFNHYYAGPLLDDRVMLREAFAGLTQQLDRLRLDQPDATMPALTGHRARDWDAFAAVYRHIIGGIPEGLRQRVAVATMIGMIATLHDSHDGWVYPGPGLPPGENYGLGITASPSADLAQGLLPGGQGAPGEALPPLFVTSVDPRSPAAKHRVRPGDIITAVDGAPPFIGEMVTPGVVSLVNPYYPQHQRVRIRLRWPVTAVVRTITITPAAYRATPPRDVTDRLLRGQIAYVAMSSFNSGTGSEVLDAIRRLAKTAKLRGVILDLRGNDGGSSLEVARLLGAFEHGTAYSYDCTITDRCTANYPDSKTPLLHLSLAVLTDRNCESACDEFAGAIKDLHLGTLIGTRTAGIASGHPQAYLLDDGSALFLSARYFVSADHEIINGIGVAPDSYLPYTAKDLATRHDPDITKALTVFGS